LENAWIMAKDTPSPSDTQTVKVLQHLLVIELWRGGLSQDQIHRRLGISIDTVNEILKDESRTIGKEDPESPSR
jgi:transposase